MNILLLVLGLAATTATAKSYDVVEGDVSWVATGTPGFLHINGTGGRLTGHADQAAGGKVTGLFTVAVVDFTTGMGLRDKHMREKYLEVGTYPKALLTIDAWTPTVADSSFTGTLTLKGQAKPVSGQASYADGKLRAAFTVMLNNYPLVGVPSWAGITVAHDVQVTVEATVK